MMRSRPSKLQTYMAMAEVAAQRSHDAETQVGSVLVKADSGAVIATGCNGFVRGGPDHLLPDTRPNKYKYILHSEMNLITNCVRHGISMADTFVVCTLTPCVTCMRLLWNAGVTEVVCKEKYRDFQDTYSMYDLNITETTTPEGFIHLKYEAYHDPQDPVRGIKP
jgi:dCMP deaminase